MNSKNSEVRQQDGEIEPFQISYTQFTRPGTKDHIKRQLLDLHKTIHTFHEIAGRINGYGNNTTQYIRSISNTK